eukprot:GHRQ01022083.1.p1 GENE.GHRQ01022083.1~~GHRQ01022083.1.p1  ORF type:complete len:151 (-),score=13.46 GHRQ01022083.1:1016-1444(-)
MDAGCKRTAASTNSCCHCCCWCDSDDAVPAAGLVFWLGVLNAVDARYAAGKKTAAQHAVANVLSTGASRASSLWLCQGTRPAAVDPGVLHEQAATCMSPDMGLNSAAIAWQTLPLSVAYPQLCVHSLRRSDRMTVQRSSCFE